MAHLGAPGEAPLECSISPHTWTGLTGPLEPVPGFLSGFLSGSWFGLGGFRDPLRLLLEPGSFYTDKLSLKRVQGAIGANTS